MTKYYVATADKKEFAYLSTVPAWCPDGGKTHLVYGATKPHLYTKERANRVLSKCKKNNLSKYQIFEIEIA